MRAFGFGHVTLIKQAGFEFVDRQHVAIAHHQVDVVERDAFGPPEPLVVFIFDPFPGDILREVIAGVDRSVREAPRKVYLAYQNPISERMVAEFSGLRKIAGTIQYAIFESQ